MMRVVYPGPIDAVEIAATGQIVRCGETVEVPDDIGKSLVSQGWGKQAKKKAEPEVVEVD